MLLLTSSLGTGHLRAAQAIEAALLRRRPRTTVQTVDFWSLMDESVAAAIRRIYLRLVAEHSDLYGRLFQLDQRAWRLVLERQRMPRPVLDLLRLLARAHREELLLSDDDGGNNVLDRLLFRMLGVAILRGSRKGSVDPLLPMLIKACWTNLARQLAGRLRAFLPDVVVATQMLPAALFSGLRGHHRYDFPAVGVLTDFGMHDYWLQPGIDTYCVSHESIPGLPSDPERAFDLRVTGIPLMPGFRTPPEASAARAELEIDLGAPVALIVGGGLGLGVEAVASRLLRRSSPHLLVMTGRNRPARRSLAALADRHPDRIRVRDWSDRMEIYLRAADVVVGKPGGMVVAETLACSRPFLATRSLRGQEDFNTRFLEHHGVGAAVSLEELPGRLDSLLANRRALGDLQRRAAALGHPDAAAAVTEEIWASVRSKSRRPGRGQS